MGIKADKTFEEIVERLVALFRPASEDADTDGHARPSSADAAELHPSPTALPAPSDDDAQS